MTAGGLAPADRSSDRERTRPTLRAVDLVPSLGGELLAVVVVRSGSLPRGAQEALDEAGGRALVVGSGAVEAAESLAGEELWAADTGPGLRPAALAAALEPVLSDTSLILMPATPDGRDLAPRLAAVLDRPLLAYAVRIGLVGGVVRAELSRMNGRLLVDVEAPAPCVATLVPAGLSSQRLSVVGAIPVQVLDLVLPDLADVEVIEVLEPARDAVELAAAARVLAVGAGLQDGELALLQAVAARLGASVGATSAVTDAGGVSPARLIGSAGISIAPELYLALGVSGASQHVAGLGAPRHLISVNTDPGAPMMVMADLALITDARALLLELAARLEVGC